MLSDALIKKGVKRSRHRDTDRHRSAQRCPDQEGSETPALGGEVVGWCVPSDALIKKGVKLSRSQ